MGIKRLLGIDLDYRLDQLPKKDYQDIHDWLNDPDSHAVIRSHHKRMNLLTGWMRKIPIVGKLVYSFWYCLIEEGIRSTIKPRWGAITFSFLNDGMKPTLWHTWRQVTHDGYDLYTGIYPMGAPKSFAQAKEWHEKWEAERKIGSVKILGEVT